MSGNGNTLQGNSFLHIIDKNNDISHDSPLSCNTQENMASPFFSPNLPFLKQKRIYFASFVSKKIMGGDSVERLGFVQVLAFEKICARISVFLNGCKSVWEKMVCSCVGVGACVFVRVG